jgi:translocation and assembly module TamB
MSGRRKFLLGIAIGFVSLLVLLAVGGYFLLRSDWLNRKLRAALVNTVETATGGRAEVGKFRFNRAQFSIEVDDFVLHGTEPAGKPPLLRAATVKVDLKLISLLKPNVDVLAVDVAEPKVYLIIGPDGRLNIPEPQIKRLRRRNTLETILDLNVDRFNVHGGTFEIESKSRVPLDLRGQNLAIQLAYEAAVPRYKGTITVAPLDVRYSDYAPQPFTMKLGLTLERNRIAVDNGRFSSGNTSIDIAGSLEDLNAPHARLQYTARASVTDIARIFRVPELRGGAGVVTGVATWTPAAGIVIAGRIHATGVEYRDASVRLDGIRAEGDLEVGGKGVDVRALRISGFYVRGAKRELVEGGIRSVELRGRDLDIRGVAMALLGGSFNGDVQLRDLRRFAVHGQVAGVQAMRVVDLYSLRKPPWDALVSGPVNVEGILRQPQDLKASVQFNLTPALSGDPVHGTINAAYDARTRTLDLGHSDVSLPHSRAEFSGVIGGTLTAHLETTDLNDFLPVLGDSAAALPLTLNNGSAIFDGTVTGDLNTPQINGHLQTTNVVYSGESIDSFEGDVSAAPDLVRIQNATVGRGSLRAQGQGSVALSNWKTTPSSAITGNATIRNAPLPELLTLAKVKNVDATGTVSTTAAVSGTVGAPRVEADLDVTKGSFQGEPFDRLTAHASHSGHLVEVRDAQITAGTKVVHVSGAYDYNPQRIDAGRLRFDVKTNAMPLESIRTVAQARSDISGTLEGTARGEIELTPGAANAWRAISLDADATAKGLRLTGQPLGDAHLTAQSQGPVLRARVDSTLAGSTVHGEGEWRLEGEYPGRATVTFSRVDLPHLRAWLNSSEVSHLAGSANGELRIEGPLLNWKAMQAELRIPSLELGPAPQTDLPAASLTVHNQGPVVAKFANSVITVESAHLIGRGTDLNVTGRIAIDQKQPLELRVEGNADLSFLHDFVPDVEASGTVLTNATVRGSLSDPQVLGRMTFQKAAFNIVDVPNGISNATGTVVFTKDRATIQSLTGETGGGTIELSGFAAYAESPIVFRIHARAREVRVRYPEGVSTTADANLNFSGTSESSTLTGNVTVLRTSINLQSDFGSFLAKSAEPVRTPSAQPGLLGGMSFDIQIETAPDTEFQSSLTEGVQAEANLRLRGTVTNPAVLGRINITQGKLQFFGTDYTVSQGSISFYNPIRVEPILNIDLETRARGIDITLTVSGPLNKLKLTPRSDPPLQFSEIVALLAQGRAPSSDPSYLRRQADNPQTFTQAGASTLLGTAIASPVAGRLQRFFGVSRLRIDPSLSGLENNPQARVTLEEQVTPDITFTYITNVTSSNPQNLRVEWAVSKKWSVVALREENGVLGLDFFFKRRIK